MHAYNKPVVVSTFPYRPFFVQVSLNPLTGCVGPTSLCVGSTFLQLPLLTIILVVRSCFCRIVALYFVLDTADAVAIRPLVSPFSLGLLVDIPLQKHTDRRTRKQVWASAL